MRIYLPNADEGGMAIGCRMQNGFQSLSEPVHLCHNQEAMRAILTFSSRLCRRFTLTRAARLTLKFRICAFCFLCSSFPLQIEQSRCAGPLIYSLGAGSSLCTTTISFPKTRTCARSKGLRAGGLFLLSTDHSLTWKKFNPPVFGCNDQAK